MLTGAATLQPDQWLPRLQLARAEASVFGYVQAQVELERARALGAPADLVASVDGEIQKLSRLPPPAHLELIATETFRDGPLTIYRTETELPRCGTTRGGDALVRLAWQAPVPVPIGMLNGGELAKAQLPGGQTGYWLRSDLGGPLPSNEHAWRLILVANGRPVQVRFVDADLAKFGPGDHMRAISMPESRDGLLWAHLQPHQPATETKRQAWQVKAGGIVVLGPNDSGTDRVSYSWPVAPDVTIAKRGAPVADRATLKGRWVHLFARNGQVVEIQVAE
jgi:hypothetical protein